MPRLTVRAHRPATPTTCVIKPYAVLAPTTSGRALIRSSPNSCAIAAYPSQAMSPYVRNSSVVITTQR